jgi:hypothetical protein
MSNEARPVVLIVEDDFLIRMSAADMVEGRLYPCRSGQRRRSRHNLGVAVRYRRRFYRHSDAQSDGRTKARRGCPRPMAADQNHCHLGTGSR